jgi:hypothetical protein
MQCDDLAQQGSLMEARHRVGCGIPFAMICRDSERRPELPASREPLACVRCERKVSYVGDSGLLHLLPDRPTAHCFVPGCTARRDCKR